MANHRIPVGPTLAVLAAALCPIALTTAQAQGSGASSVDAHVAKATQLAGTDLTHLLPLCKPQPAERAKPSAAMDDGLRKLIAKPAPPATQVFATCTSSAATG